MVVKSDKMNGSNGNEGETSQNKGDKKRPISSGDLEKQALQRRERLRFLRERRAKAESSDGNADGSNEPLPGPIFRNYKPLDENLQETVLPDAPTGDIISEIKDQLDASNTKVVIDELDIANLAPRKPDWDLKRDVAKKLEKLERRTQKAIAELIWERLKRGQDDNINAMVTLATSQPSESKS